MSGIGQVVKKYSFLDEKNSRHVVFGEEYAKKKGDCVFAFVLPIKNELEYVKRVYDPDVVMTVCETDPVNSDYKMIFEIFKASVLVVPSQFCRDIFKNQFNVDTHVFPHYVKPPQVTNEISSKTPYVFYTIGNMLDPRKNVKMLLEAFIRCNFPKGSAKLLIKSTALRPIHINLPNVEIINGLVSDEEIDRIHNTSHCYVNCSHSEGVGMGAVEAALRDKPVIITDFGGLKEYVDTPFKVHCEIREMGFSDFLFQPHMKWGFPSLTDLTKHMKQCYDQNIRTWNHQHTRDFTSRNVLHAKLSEYFRLALARRSVHVSSLTETDDGDWLVLDRS